jgi:hypothetical protein
MLLDKKTFNFRRTTIPTAAKEQQARMKRAMRAAINAETWDFRFDQIVNAARAGDMRRANLYRFRRGWDVSHRTPLSSLIHSFLLQNQLYWEDMTVHEGASFLNEPGLSRWRNWHRSYTETNDNLFLQPQDLNRREPRQYFDLPSRDFGSF